MTSKAREKVRWKNAVIPPDIPLEEGKITTYTQEGKT